MANQEKGARSSLFLIELILVLFFFLLVASVCIQIFVKAYSMSRSSRELSHAQSQCASVSEILTGTREAAPALSQYFPEGEMKEEGFCISYDQDFAACESDQAVYMLTVHLSDITSGNIVVSGADLKFTRGEEVIYTLTVNWHIPSTAGEEAAL